MSALSDLYQHIVQALYETVDGIPFVDMDFGQLKKGGEEITIEYPALLIRFENVYWKEYDASKQLGAVHVRLKFIYPYTNENEYLESTDGIRNEVVSFFEIIQNIHTAVSSIPPSTHTLLYRFNENHLENKPEEMKWIYCLDYYCHIFSDGTSMGDGSTYEIDYSLIQRTNMFLENTISERKVG